MNRDVCEHFNPLDLDCSQCGRKAIIMNYEYDMEEFFASVDGILGQCTIVFSGDPGELWIDYIETQEGTVIDAETIHPDIIKGLTWKAEEQVLSLGDDVRDYFGRGSYGNDAEDVAYDKYRQEIVDKD